MIVRATVLFGPQLTPSLTPLARADLPGPSQWLSDTIPTAIAWCMHRPWLAIVAATVLIVSQAVQAAVARRRQRAMVRHATLVTITPPPEVDPAGVTAFWATMAEILSAGWRRRQCDGRSHIAMEYRWAGRRLSITVWVPGTLQTGPIQAAVRG
ncbi:MAG TPA: type VI secretion protein, partial [Micromonosporaceae bacterium]|nr:type VI secretion protein [Micromonosporaceae bacterium]